MSDKERHIKFLKQVKKVLDEGAEGLDPGTQSRLTQIRRKAIESKTAWSFPSWLYQPALQWSAVACALLLGVLYFADPDKSHYQLGLEDIDLLASTDVLELYEDLEFYAWLAEENVEAS